MALGSKNTQPNYETRNNPHSRIPDSGGTPCPKANCFRKISRAEYPTVSYFYIYKLFL